MFLGVILASSSFSFHNKKKSEPGEMSQCHAFVITQAWRPELKSPALIWKKPGTAMNIPIILTLGYRERRSARPQWPVSLGKSVKDPASKCEFESSWRRCLAFGIILWPPRVYTGMHSYTWALRKNQATFTNSQLKCLAWSLLNPLFIQQQINQWIVWRT